MARRRKRILAGKPLHCQPTLADVRRFVGKLHEVAPPTETAHLVVGKCWVFSGYADDEGYGQFKVQKRAVWAHRFSAQVFGGIDLSNLEANHICLRRNCCNPAHHEGLTRSANGAKISRAKREPAPF